MKKLFFIFMSFLFLVNCSNDDIDTSRMEEQQILDEKFMEIIEQAMNNDCDNDENWSFIAIGNKACGGPSSFIIYSTMINTVEFLNKVNKYTQAEANFNEKWEIISDCSTPRIPIGVSCVNGRPELVY